MLNRRLPRNAYITPGTHDDSTHLVPPLHSLRAPLFSLSSGVLMLTAIRCGNSCIKDIQEAVNGVSLL